jgi:hypothetical protein
MTQKIKIAENIHCEPGVWLCARSLKFISLFHFGRKVVEALLQKRGLAAS